MIKAETWVEVSLPCLAFLLLELCGFSSYGNFKEELRRHF